MMNNQNSHVEDFLNYYCSLDIEPGYAVLLKGKWGTGKTWFIQKVLDSLSVEGRKHLYVSLYGVASFEEIEDEFFKQLHPLLSSKSMALAGKIAKGLLKASLKVDLDRDGSSDGSVSAKPPDIDLPEYLTNTENFVIVFDDLERTSMDLEKILGYINHFVEHQGYKVIIVANEDEIYAQQNSDEDYINSYKRIKEKLIGKTFEIEADLQGALSEFISKIQNDCIRDLYGSNAEVISDLYTSSGYKNLRHLKQALWDYERLSAFISDEAIAKDGLLLHLLKIFLALSFEIKSGEMLPDEILALRSEYLSGTINRDSEENKNTNYRRMSGKYGTLDLSDLLVEESIWVDLIDRGYCSADKIQESLESSEYFRNENTPEWQKLWHSMWLSDEEFEYSLNFVLKEFEARKYDELGVVKHVVGILLWLSTIGLFGKDRSEILVEAKQYIDHLKSKDLLVIDSSMEARFRLNESWGGLGFHERNSEEFLALTSYIDKLANEAIVEKYPVQGDELLKLIDTDPELFYRKLIISNDAKSSYYEIPILNYIDPEIFVSAFLGAMPRAKDSVCFALKKRYEYDDFRESLTPEFDWLKRVVYLLECEKQKLEGKLSGYQLQSRINNYFKVALEAFENHESSKSQSNAGVS